MDAGLNTKMWPICDNTPEFANMSHNERIEFIRSHEPNAHIGDVKEFLFDYECRRFGELSKDNYIDTSTNHENLLYEEIPPSRHTYRN